MEVLEIVEGAGPHSFYRRLSSTERRWTWTWWRTSVTTNSVIFYLEKRELNKNLRNDSRRVTASIEAQTIRESLDVVCTWWTSMMNKWWRMKISRSSWTMKISSSSSLRLKKGLIAAHRNAFMPSPDPAGFHLPRKGIQKEWARIMASADPVTILSTEMNNLMKWSSSSRS